ncbi:MAG: phosphomannomutase/phosphoglucomutase [Acetobacterales bacterium]
MTEGRRLDPTILREYDIRGIVGESLTADDARAIGRAFAMLVAAEGGDSVCIGYDGRLSSPELEAAAVDGIVSAGVDAWRIGQGPTPMLYYAAKTLQAGGGMMITGSHNPPEYNGFKMVIGGRPFFGKDIVRLGQVAAEGAAGAAGKGSATQRAVADDYVDRLLQDYDGDGGLKVVWDCGNGVTGDVVRALTAKLPGDHHLLFDEIDGRFPNHHPDPTVQENLEDLREEVARLGADLGIAFDGDGDRIGVVDGEGVIIWGDQLLILLARDVLAQRPGATIIADVKASKVLFDEIAAAGGKPLMWRTGHSLIKSKMAETGSPLAGEMSGHIFFADRYYGFDDAPYAAIRLLGLLSRSGRSLAEQRRALPQVLNTPEVRFDCAEDRKFRVIDSVKQRLKAEGADVNDVDGVRVTTADGWWLLRASNTQAVLVARCEGRDEAGLERLKAEVRKVLADTGVEAPPSF